MKFYLSSYRLGNKTELLKEFLKNNKRIGYIPNALDHSKDLEWLKKHIERDIKDLENIAVQVELLDLKNYFGKQNELKKKIFSLGGIWISGGNTFVLRNAMARSGLDDLLVNELSKRTDFVYSGYSAAGCVLSPSLKVYQIVDDSSQVKEPIWTGLGLVDWAFMPHYKSDHPESADVDKEIELCKKNKIKFKAIKDGEVIIIA